MKRAVDGIQLREAYSQVSENMMSGIPMTIITTDDQPQDDQQHHHGEDQPDPSEMEMAKSDIHKAIEYSQKLSELLQNMPSLEGWTASKITKAADYLSSVYHWLDYETTQDGEGQSQQDSGCDMYNMGAEDSE